MGKYIGENTKRKLWNCIPSKKDEDKKPKIQLSQDKKRSPQQAHKNTHFKHLYASPIAPLLEISH